MTSLYETAINGMMVGTKASDLNQAYLDRKAAGAHLEAELLLKIGVEMAELESAERLAQRDALNLGNALARFQDNPSISNSEWLTHYAAGADKNTRNAQAAYSKVGELWALYKMTQV
jgi:hypothetical protein